MNEVFVDIGHGGSDPGAVNGKDTEKQWNLDTGLACITELERHGVIVHTSRITDKALSITERCNLANKTKATHFISIHHNAGGGDRGEVIYSISNSGKPLAEKIGTELQLVGQTNMKIYNKAGTNNKDYYGVIRGTNAIAVIVEACFIDNVADRQIADTYEKRNTNGIAIAHGILKTLGISIKPDITPEVVVDGDRWYRVIVGSYKDEDNAKSIKSKLEKEGYQGIWIMPFYKDGDRWHRIIAGSYRGKDNAKSIKSKLDSAGYQGVWIDVFYQ